MNRLICVLLALIISDAALAAPAPKPKPFVTGWENPIDPDSDCKIKRDKGVLSIEMPGTIHEYDPYHKLFNAPRIIRKIAGDFEMQVRLRFARRTSTVSTGDQHPYVAAGFFVIPFENIPTKFCRMEYRVAGFGVSPNGYVAQDVWDNKISNGHIVGDKEWSFKGEPEQIYLRLERCGEKLHYSISPDGKVWVKKTPVIRIKSLPSKIKVGMAAYSTSAEASKVQIDQLKLARIKKKLP